MLHRSLMLSLGWVVVQAREQVGRVQDSLSRGRTFWEGTRKGVAQVGVDM